MVTQLQRWIKGELTRIQLVSEKTGKPLNKYEYWEKGMIEFDCWKTRFPLRRFFAETPIWKEWTFKIKKFVYVLYYCRKTMRTISFQHSIPFTFWDFIKAELFEGMTKHPTRKKSIKTTRLFDFLNGEKKSTSE